MVWSNTFKSVVILFMEFNYLQFIKSHILAQYKIITFLLLITFKKLTQTQYLLF